MFCDVIFCSAVIIFDRRHSSLLLLCRYSWKAGVNLIWMTDWGLNHFHPVDLSILINWMSPFPISEVSGVLFNFYLSFDKNYCRLYEPRHEKTCFCPMQTTKVQISLRIHAVWSAPLLFAPYNTCASYIRNFKPLASLSGCAGWFLSCLVANPDDRFSHDEDRIIWIKVP